MLRIKQIADDSETVLTLIERITSRNVQQLKAGIAEARNRVTLDLQQVWLVNLDAVHFLAPAERMAFTSAIFRSTSAQGSSRRSRGR